MELYAFHQQREKERESADPVSSERMMSQSVFACVGLLEEKQCKSRVHSWPLWSVQVNHHTQPFGSRSVSFLGTFSLFHVTVVKEEKKQKIRDAEKSIQVYE